MATSRKKVIKASIVLPPDTNYHGTLFGGKLMAYIDDVAALCAMRHARRTVVTASTDSVDFLTPVRVGQSVCLEAMITWTGKSSMEVFVTATAEDLMSGQRTLAATAFLTFVALDENGKPTPVSPVQPETDEEWELYNTAPERMEHRKKRRIESQMRAEKYKKE